MKHDTKTRLSLAEFLAGFFVGGFTQKARLVFWYLPRCLSPA